MHHKVSVIVPSMNVERTLDAALSSIERQTYPDIEILALNDGSTDGTLAVMQAHAARDPRIRVTDKQNEGYGATCNRGIDMAEGDYIAIVEPDDWIEPAFFADLLALADTLEGPVDVIKSAYWRVFDQDPEHTMKVPCAYKGRVHPRHQPFAIAEAPELLLHHPAIWSALYRKEWLDEKRIRFMEIPGAGWADNPFLIETLCQTPSIAYIDRCYYCYREDTTNESLAFAKKHPLLLMERWNDMEDIIDRLDIEDESVLFAQTKRCLTYAGITVEAVGMDHPGVEDALLRSFLRLDPAIALGSRHISPSAKRLFCHVLGLSDEGISNAVYIPELISEAWHRLITCGPAYTFRSATDFLHHTDARDGSRG